MMADQGGAALHQPHTATADNAIHNNADSYNQHQQHQMLQTPEILLRSVVDRVIMDEDDDVGGDSADRQPHHYYYNTDDSCNVKHFSAEHTPYERMINGNVILSTSNDNCNNSSSIFGAGDCAKPNNYASNAYFSEDALVAAMHNDCASAFADDIINHATAALSPLQFGTNSYNERRNSAAANNKGSVVLRLCNEQQQQFQHQQQYDPPNDTSSLFYSHHQQYRDEKTSPSPSSSATPEPTMLVVKPPMSPASTTPALSSSASSSTMSRNAHKSSRIDAGQHAHQHDDANEPAAAHKSHANSAVVDSVRIEKQNMLERLGYKLRLPKLPPATLYDPNYRQRIVEANRFWQTSLASHITISSCRNYLLHHQRQSEQQQHRFSAAHLFTSGGAGDPAACATALNNVNFPSLQELQHHLPKPPHGPSSLLTTQLSIESGAVPASNADNNNCISEQDLTAVNRTGRLSDSGYFGRRVRARARKLTSERRLILSTAMHRSNQQHAAIVQGRTPSSSSSASSAQGAAANIEQALSQPNNAAGSTNSDCMYEFEVHELSEATLTLLSAIYERLQTHLGSIAQQATQKALQNSAKVVALSILKNVRQAIENVVEVFDNVEGQRAAQQNSNTEESTASGFLNSKTFSGVPADRSSNRNLSLLFILYMPMSQPDTLCLRCIIPLLNANAPVTPTAIQKHPVPSNNSNNSSSSLTNVPSWPKLNGANPASLLTAEQQRKGPVCENVAPAEKATQPQRAAGMRKQIGVVTRPLTLSSWGEIYFKDESDAREDNLRNTIMPFGFAQLSSVFKNKIIVPNNADPSHVVINCGQVLEFKIATSGLYQPLATFSDFTPLDLLYPNLSLHDRFRGVLTRLFRHLDSGYVYSPYHEKMFSFHLCDVMYDMAPPRVGDAVEFTLRRVSADTHTINNNTAATSATTVALVSVSSPTSSSAVAYTACDVLTLPEGAFGRVRVEDEKHYNGAVIRAANAEHDQAGIIELRMSSSSTAMANNLFFNNNSSSTSMGVVPLPSSASSSSHDMRNSNDSSNAHVASANSSTDCMPTMATAKSSAISMSGNSNKRFAFYEHSFEYDQSSIADVGYVVSFRLLHDPFTSRDLFGYGIAINLKIEAGLVRKRGHILALFDNYGFIELDSREDAWFHFSRLINCRSDELFIGCPVEYSLLPKLPEKPTQQACYVRRLRKDGIVGYDRLLSQQTFRGEVLQAMRAVTPFQKQYYGKIALYGPTTAMSTSQSAADNNNSGGCNNNNNNTLATAAADEIIARLTTPGADNTVIFTFSGLCDKRDHLRIGDIVSFKLATFRASGNKNAADGSSNQTTAAAVIEPRAVDISRIMFRLRVRNIKRVDQFGFLDFYGSDLFFHLSHVSDGDAIKPGDIVECVVRRDRTQRPCATSVVRRFWGKKALAMQESHFWLHTPQDLIVRDIINMRSGTTSAGVPPSSVVIGSTASATNGPQLLVHTPQRSSLSSSSSNIYHPVHNQRQHFYRPFNNNNNNTHTQGSSAGYRHILSHNNNSFANLQMLRSLSSSTNHSTSTNNLALLSTASSPYPMMPLAAAAAAALQQQQPHMFANIQQQQQAFAMNPNYYYQQLNNMVANQARADQQQQQQYTQAITNPQQYVSSAMMMPNAQAVADLSLYYQQLRSAGNSRASGALSAVPIMPHQQQFNAAFQPQQLQQQQQQQQSQQQPATAAELLELAPLLAPFAAYYQQQLQQQQQQNLQQQQGNVAASMMMTAQQHQQQPQYVDMAYYSQAIQQQQSSSSHMVSTAQQQQVQQTASQNTTTNNNAPQPYQILSHAQPTTAPTIMQQSFDVSSGATPTHYRSQPTATTPVSSTSLSSQQQQQQPLPLWRRRDDDGISHNNNNNNNHNNGYAAVSSGSAADYNTNNAANLLCALRTFQQQQQQHLQTTTDTGGSFSSSATFSSGGTQQQQTHNNRTFSQQTTVDNAQYGAVQQQLQPPSTTHYRLQLSSPTGSPSCPSLNNNRNNNSHNALPRASASAVSAVYTHQPPNGSISEQQQQQQQQRSSRLSQQNNFGDASSSRVFGGSGARKLDRSRSVDRVRSGGGGDNMQFNLIQTALHNNNNNGQSNVSGSFAGNNANAGNVPTNLSIGDFVPSNSIGSSSNSILAAKVRNNNNNNNGSANPTNFRTNLM